jgi:hypothetical protein
MASAFMRLVCALATPLLACGCAATSAPRANDPGYPPGWPAREGLGAGCQRLNGGYVNDGVFVDASGSTRQLRLTDLFLRREAIGARNVTVLVTPTRFDQHQDAFATVQLVAHIPGGDVTQQGDAFCVKEVLFLVASTSSRGLPYVFVEADQKNTWLSSDADGNLIVKIGQVGAGLVLVAPFAWQSVGWARFRQSAD